MEFLPKVLLLAVYLTASFFAFGQGVDCGEVSGSGEKPAVVGLGFWSGLTVAFAFIMVLA